MSAHTQHYDATATGDYADAIVRAWAVRAWCPQCNGAGHRHHGVFSKTARYRDPIPSDFVPCAECSGTGKRSYEDVANATVCPLPARAALKEAGL